MDSKTANAVAEQKEWRKYQQSKESFLNAQRIELILLSNSGSANDLPLA